MSDRRAEIEAALLANELAFEAAHLEDSSTDPSPFWEIMEALEAELASLSPEVTA